MHAGKIALVTGTTPAPWYETEGPYKNAIYFEILLEEKLISGVGAKWLETINETRGSGRCPHSQRLGGL